MSVKPVLRLLAVMSLALAVASSAAHQLSEQQKTEPTHAQVLPYVLKAASRKELAKKKQYSNSLSASGTGLSHEAHHDAKNERDVDLDDDAEDGADRTGANGVSGNPSSKSKMSHSHVNPSEVASWNRIAHDLTQLGELHAWQQDYQHYHHQHQQPHQESTVCHCEIRKHHHHLSGALMSLLNFGVLSYVLMGVMALLNRMSFHNRSPAVSVPNHLAHLYDHLDRFDWLKGERGQLL